MPLEEIDDIEFEILLADKRHKELKSLLGQIIKAYSESNKSDILTALQNQVLAIKEFAGAIKAIPAPITNVELNQNKIADAIDRMETKFATELGNIKKEMEVKHEWQFTLTRNGGFIETVKAKQIK